MKDYERTLAQRLAPIAMLILDVDGVLTDGGIVYSDGGMEWKSFHVRDGSGLKIWEWLGKRSAIITGRKSPIVEVRAAELGITPVVQGAANKLPAYRQILSLCGLKDEQVCYIGDDLPDLPMLRWCGFAVAVGDACAEVKMAAHYVTRAEGGRGAVRETIEMILRCQGLWPRAVERFRGDQP